LIDLVFKVLTAYYKALAKLRKLRIILSVPSDSLVLDIGGGDGPFPRAQVLCEKFIDGNVERVDQMRVGKDQFLVIGDIHELPFRDGAFDFVHCSHVLEHTHDPSLAIKEITRVAGEGYVEVPSQYNELAAESMESHIWTVRQEPQEGLVFEQKRSATPTPYLRDVFRNRLMGKSSDPAYTAFHWKNLYSLFHISLLWKKSIPHTVKPLPKNQVADDFVKGEEPTPQSIIATMEKRKNGAAPRDSLKQKLKTKVGSFLSHTTKMERIWDLLACPACKSPLNKSGDQLTCTACRRTYPVYSGVPVLLTTNS
jgi:uncharacterized protein YbaR (Trm112 family)/SAM-dependent methyltransferase